MVIPVTALVGAQVFTPVAGIPDVNRPAAERCAGKRRAGIVYANRT
jgi:hypothetical protein